MTKKQLLDSIRYQLSICQTYVKTNTKNNLTDFPLYCEDLFCDILNLIFSLKLENLNKKAKNTPVIDLADPISKVCYQITAENNSSKISETIRKFSANTTLYKEYSQLNILILGEKKKYKTVFPEYVTIIDLNDLFNFISLIPNVKIIEKIYNILLQDLPLFTDTSNSLLRTFQSTIVTSGNYYSFASFLACEDTTLIPETINDINYFIKEISILHQGLRELIYLACINRISPTSYPFKEYVYFNYDSLYYGGINQNNLYSLLRQLENSNHLQNEEDYEKTCSLTFFNPTRDYDILSSLDIFCKEHHIDLKAILCDLNFSLLD